MTSSNSLRRAVRSALWITPTILATSIAVAQEQEAAGAPLEEVIVTQSGGGDSPI